MRDVSACMRYVFKRRMKMCSKWYYCSIPGKHPLPGKHPCTKFQGINVAASILASKILYGYYIPGKNAHVDQNCELCLSAHGCLPGTLRYVGTCMYMA